MSIRDEVRERSGGNCEARMIVCTGRAQHIHHKLMRSQGGENTQENMIAVCLRCHHQIHMNPKDSYAHGFLRRRFEVVP